MRQQQRKRTIPKIRLYRLKGPRPKPSGKDKLAALIDENVSITARARRDARKTK